MPSKVAIEQLKASAARALDYEESDYSWGNEVPLTPKPKAAPVAPTPIPSTAEEDLAALVALERNQVEAVVEAAKAPAPSAQPKKGPSLRAFVNTDVEFEGSEWTYERIMEGITQENWRARDVDEAIKEGDLIHRLGDTPGVYVVERVQGLKDQTLTQEYIDYHQLAVYTLEGGGKKKAPPHGKTTADFASIYAVPTTLGSANGTKDKLELPTDETEARRFFGTEVMVAEQIRKGKPTKVFFPSIPTLKDRKLRAAFSQVFGEFSRKHLRDSLKGVIAGRGEGIRLKRGCSPNHILKAAASSWPHPVSEKPTLHTVCNHVQQQIERESDETKRKALKAKLSLYQNMDESTIDAVLARNDYRPKGAPVKAQIPFIKRMEGRELNPTEFLYEKAIGIEIETLCPMNRTEAQKRIPHFMRAAQDNSIKDNDGRDTHGSEGNGKGLYGCEFRILIKRSEMEARVGKAVEALNQMGCSVNKTCGLHVHFDMRGKKEAEVVVIADRLIKWLKALIELLPAGRRDNQYCKLEGYDRPHWAGVSMDAFKKHQTLEIRVHSGTLSQIKLIRWISLLETLMSMTFTPLANVKTSTLDALKMLPLSEADRTYWLKRHQHLNKELYRTKDATLPKEQKTPKLDMSFLDKPDEIE